MTGKILPFDVAIATADVPNKNGRIYTTECLQKAVDALENAQCIGQLGMPEESPSILMTNASHYISNLHMVDSELMGTVHVLETAEGKRLRYLLESGIQFDYRTSGRGDIDENGVVTNFVLHSINAVSDGA